MAKFAPAWGAGMAALRSMRAVRKVAGRIKTDMSEIPAAGSFEIEWKGLDGLGKAFIEGQREEVAKVYELFVLWGFLGRGECVLILV